MADSKGNDNTAEDKVNDAPIEIKMGKAEDRGYDCLSIALNIVKSCLLAASISSSMRAMIRRMSLWSTWGMMTRYFLPLGSHEEIRGRGGETDLPEKRRRICGGITRCRRLRCNGEQAEGPANLLQLSVA